MYVSFSPFDKNSLINSCCTSLIFIYQDERKIRSQLLKDILMVSHGNGEEEKWSM
jgi:phosphotransferase system IIB component